MCKTEGGADSGGFGDDVLGCVLCFFSFLSGGLVSRVFVFKGFF